jgi:UDP-3-O-[3-hydroxymyristoyl] glucosamine N-acyltransferase
MLAHSNNKPVCVLGHGTVADSVVGMLSADGILVIKRDAESAMNSEDYVDYQYLLGIVKNTKIRKQVIQWTKQQQLNCPVFVHNQSFVANINNIGPGTIVFPQANILNSTIGSHCMFAPFSHVGHRALVGDSCLFLPYSAALGSSKLASFIVLQTRSTVADMVQVTPDSVNILPNSLVTKNIDIPGTYGGSSARFINSNTTDTAQYFNQ